MSEFLNYTGSAVEIFNILVAGFCIGWSLRGFDKRTSKREEAVAPSDKHTTHVVRAGAGKGKVHVALPCGAKILELDEYEIADTPGTVDRNQPESVRKGGVFFQCYGRCPFCYDCSYVKAFADLHLGKDFSLPLERGKRLELKRRNGHRCVALVDESDVEVKTIPLTGVSYLGRAERYTTVPPLFQDVEDPRKDD